MMLLSAVHAIPLDMDTGPYCNSKLFLLLSEYSRPVPNSRSGGTSPDPIVPAMCLKLSHQCNKDKLAILPAHFISTTLPAHNLPAPSHLPSFNRSSVPIEGTEANSVSF